MTKIHEINSDKGEYWHVESSTLIEQEHHEKSEQKTINITDRISPICVPFQWTGVHDIRALHLSHLECNVVVINVISVRDTGFKEFRIYSPLVPLNKHIHEHLILVKSTARQMPHEEEAGAVEGAASLVWAWLGATVISVRLLCLRCTPTWYMYSVMGCCWVHSCERAHHCKAYWKMVPISHQQKCGVNVLPELWMLCFINHTSSYLNVTISLKRSVVTGPLSFFMSLSYLSGVTVRLGKKTFQSRQWSTYCTVHQKHPVVCNES